MRKIDFTISNKLCICDICGNVHCRYDDGSYVTGTWNHGIRNGPFTFDTNKQESEVTKSSASENLSFLLG